MSSEFKTGISPLDRQLPNGIPPGSLLLVKARPDTQSELLLQTFANNKDSIYITTTRNKNAVESKLNESPFLINMPHIIDVPTDSPLDELKNKVHGLPEDSYIIIDSIDIVEDLGKTRYQSFLNSLQKQMIDTESVAVIHAYKYPDQNTPKNRYLTEGISDIVFNLDFYEEGGDIETKLIVSKFRGGRALDESLKVTLTDEVDIDTSRDI